ncbi:MAG: ChrR family anti-sigma-E factor, partial [Shewanella sp.]
MIKHHPHDSLLLAHANGELALSMSIALSAHCELCEHCQAALAAYTEQAARAAFSPAPTFALSPKAARGNQPHQDAETLEPLTAAPFESMLEQIFSQGVSTEPVSAEPVAITFKKQEY